MDMFTPADITIIGTIAGSFATAVVTIVTFQFLTARRLDADRRATELRMDADRRATQQQLAVDRERADADRRTAGERLDATISALHQAVAEMRAARFDRTRRA